MQNHLLVTLHCLVVVGFPLVLLLGSPVVQIVFSGYPGFLQQLYSSTGILLFSAFGDRYFWHLDNPSCILLVRFFDIPSFHPSFIPLMSQNISIEPGESLSISLLGLLFWGNFVQCCQPCLICTFQVDVWIFYSMTEIKHI